MPRSSSECRAKLLVILKPAVSIDSKTGELVLSASSQLQVVVLGRVTSVDTCSAARKDGKPCTLLVDRSVISTCTYHTPRYCRSEINNSNSARLDTDNRAFGSSKPTNAASRPRQAAPATRPVPPLPPPAAAPEALRTDLMHAALHGPKIDNKIDNNPRQRECVPSA